MTKPLKLSIERKCRYCHSLFLVSKYNFKKVSCSPECNIAYNNLERKNKTDEKIEDRALTISEKQKILERRI